VMEVFPNAAPKTVANFLALCTGEKGRDAHGHRLHYRDSPIHRVIPGLYQ
jgi:peptidylprolyl isomerase